MRTTLLGRPALLALVAIAFVFSTAAAADIDARAPGRDAPAHKWFQAESKGGLKYGWLVPKDYDAKTPRNLTVILHGTGLDWRWGPANNPAGVFRPLDIVVSADGTSPDGKTRLFLDGKDDIDAFADFLGEMKAVFAVRNVFLYGHSQGGFFVVHFAGEHPELVAGVVAHASGAWNWSKMGAPVKKVAIAFMHGTLDPVVPYVQSPGSRDAYVKQGFKLVHLRRLQNYNHWPNAVRATECLDWCEGMTTDDPATALAAVRRILEPKRADEYQWSTVVGFSGARDVLRRIEGQGPAPFKDVDAKVASEAAAIVKKIDEHAAKHVKALEKDVPSRKKLAPGGEWLGHLVPLREDFRGIEVVEAYIKKIDYDDVLDSQAKAREKIWQAWSGSGDEKKIFGTVVDSIDDAFLVEGLPYDLAAKMEKWKNQTKTFGIDKKTLEKYAAFEAWKTGWDKGRKQYQSLWDDWKGP